MLLIFMYWIAVFIYCILPQNMFALFVINSLFKVTYKPI